MKLEVQKCPLCERALGHNKFLSKHHLIPKSKGGKYGITVTLHNICHQKIHSIFSEKELKMEYNTIEKLAAHEDIIKFVKWVAKKDVDFYRRNKWSNKRKG